MEVCSHQPNNEVVKLSKGQRKRRNRAARAATAAAKRKTSDQLLPPKPSPFLRLHADIFSQIIPNLAPLDVVYLAQVNKSIRRMLMHRSARSMWRACVENTTGLPACPPELSEPQYVSLLFQPRCSSCGAKEGRNPDAFLRVRLCPPCRRQLLTDWEKIDSEEVQALVLVSGMSCNRNQRKRGLEFNLKHEVEAVTTRLNKLKSSDDTEALQSWIQSREEELDEQEKHADLVIKFFRAARRAKRKELTPKWREQVKSKLLELGHLKKEIDVHQREKGSAWMSFVSRAEVWTEEKWNRLKPAFVSFIESDAQKRAQRERERNQAFRNVILWGLYDDLRQRVDLGTPHSRLKYLSPMEVATLTIKWLPPPQYDEALKWPILRSLLETDVSSEDMTDRFGRHRGETKQLIVDRGKLTKQEWAGILREGREKDGLAANPSQVRLPVDKPETDPFEHADGDTKLLLRADSIFAFGSKSDIYSYDELFQCSDETWAFLDLKPCTFHSQASAVARTLLAALGRPNASGPELNSVWFKCGRCSISLGTSWIYIIRHYVEEAKNWENVRTRLTTFSELGITYRNVHDLECDDPRPLITQLSAQEITDTKAKLKRLNTTLWVKQVEEELGLPRPTLDPKLTEDGVGPGHSANNDQEAEPDEDWEDLEEEEEEEEEEDLEIWQRDRPACKLCEQGNLGVRMFAFMDIPALFDHLRNVHDISDPERGLILEDRESIKNSPYFRLCIAREGPSLGYGITIT